ncbi:hypothetical protein BDW22DRAFT_1353285 [Trametopsis cervina]|nr:hypothetical protein BDW22DRAFT_1353285 [Trametopsis cervina]
MPPPPMLSPELLFDAVAFAVAQYVDDLLAGPLEGQGQLSQVAPSLTDELLISKAYNPIIALLQTSYQFRHVTLLVLSLAFNLPLDSSGIGRLQCHPLVYLHDVRSLIWESRSSKLLLHEAHALSEGKDAKILEQYMLILDIQATTSLVLSPLRLATSIVSDDALELFDYARNSYAMLLSPKHLSPIPDPVQAYARARLIETLSQFFSALPLALNLCLRQFIAIMKAHNLRGDMLQDAYETAIHNVEVLKGVLGHLRDIERVRPVFTRADTLQILRGCTAETCDELYDVSPNADVLSEHQADLRTRVQQLRDALKSDRGLI